MQKHFSVTLVVLTTLFSVCLIASNFFETKLIQLGSITSTAGLMLFPISYIVNDLVAEVWGYRVARFVIWQGFAMNFLVVLFCFLTVALPSPDFWDGATHFNFVFGMAPRIVLASFVAFLTGSFLNAYVMSRMKLWSNGRNFSLRAVVSTLVGESADSLIFFPIAFYGLVPNSELLIMIGTQAGLKTLYELLILPVTNLVVKWVKRREQTDVYDRGISYNVLKVNEL